MDVDSKVHKVPNTAITLLGKDFLSRSTVTTRSLDSRVTIGISPGHTNHNEDAVGAAIVGERTILAIADGHWGDEASILAITETIGLLAKNQFPHGNEPIGWFYILFERLNQTLLSQALQDDILRAPETSLIVAHITHRKDGTNLVHWASFGDSFLYLVRTNGEAEQLNCLQSTWLGALSALRGAAERGKIIVPYTQQDRPDIYQNVADGLHVGIADLLMDDLLILATDGIPQCTKRNITSLHPSDIAKLVCKEETVLTICETLISAALKAGGVDNIAVAVYKNISQQGVENVR